MLVNLGMAHDLSRQLVKRRMILAQIMEGLRTIKMLACRTVYPLTQLALVVPAHHVRIELLIGCSVQTFLQTQFPADVRSYRFTYIYLITDFFFLLGAKQIAEKPHCLPPSCYL